MERIDYTPKNLIGKQKRITPGKMASEYGRKGGAAGKGSKALSLSRKITWLKKKGLTDESAQQIYELMVSSDMSSLDILMYIKKMQSKASDNKEMNVIAGRLLDWHKLHHGERKQLDVNVKTLNLNEPIPPEMLKLLTEDFNN